MKHTEMDILVDEIRTIMEAARADLFPDSVWKIAMLVQDGING